ncbi:MAG: deoxyribonuclease IV [Planctomycetota bacterium]|nr:deoxyribonuclease IV [Planctomycetota bacterium]
MFGSHLSTAGGLENALIRAREMNMECVQVFTKNQRQWASKPLTGEQIRRWREHVESTGIREIVSHDSYLINLAASDRTIREKSIRLFREEIERCEALEIPYLVTHPGAHVGQGEAKGLDRVVRALDRVHRGLRGYRTVTCLEITAGQGTTLGYRFDHLRTIRDGVREPERLTVCFDTAHALAAGYDLTSRAGARRVFDEFDDVIGREHLRVFHLNDSKVPRGRRVDRHEHIGQGHVSLEAFAYIVNHREFRSVPKILETPKGVDGRGREWDEVNLSVLRKLIKKKVKRQR